MSERLMIELTQADIDRLCDPKQTSSEEFLAVAHRMGQDRLVNLLERFVEHLRNRGIQVQGAGLFTPLATCIEEFARMEICPHD